MLTRPARVHVAPGRRVDGEHAALRARGELLRGLLLGEVEAPVPRGDGDSGAKAEELDSVDRGGLAVEHDGALPAVARLAQGVLGLVVPGHENRRLGDSP